MKILAIDASGQAASVALLSEDTLVAEYTINYKKTHSQTLVPMIEEIIKMTEESLSSIDVIAVSAGPGSFTGLRIGAATAKGLALALEKKIIAVPTVDMLAYNFFGAEQLVCPMMDARRSQVYTGLYEFQGEEFNILTKQKACALEEIINEVNQCGRTVIFLGDGAMVYHDNIVELVKVPYIFSSSHLSVQRAGSLAALAARYYKEGKLIESDEFIPEYLRLSQAERELEERAERLSSFNRQVCEIPNLLLEAPSKQTTHGGKNADKKNAAE